MGVVFIGAKISYSSSGTWSLTDWKRSNSISWTAWGTNGAWIPNACHFRELGNTLLIKDDFD